MKPVPLRATATAPDPADVVVGLMPLRTGTGLGGGPGRVNTCGEDVPKPGFVTVIDNWPPAEMAGIVAFRVSESTKLLWSVADPARTTDPGKKFPPRSTIDTCGDES